MLQDFAIILGAYTAPKLIALLAAKAGVLPVAHAAAAVAPTIMSYTFFAAVGECLPKLAGAALIPQCAFTLLAFGSLGPNGYVIKNMILPTIAGFAGFYGWFSAELAGVLPLASALKKCTMACCITLTLLHVLYVARAVAVRMVYPAPIIAKVLDIKALRDKALTRDGISRHSVPSSENPGVTLDALFYRTVDCAGNKKGGTEATAAAAASAPQRRFASFPNAWIIYVGGNGEICEGSIDSARTYAVELGASAAVFNPRGVGESGGLPVSSSAELVADSADVIRYIMKEYGAKEEHIILFGHSIGGGISSELAAKHFPNVSIVLDRTFSSLYDAARSMMPQLPELLVRRGLPLFFGEFPNYENWDLITHDRKTVSFHAEDQIIRYNRASLARMDDFSAQGGKYEKHVVELSGRAADPHNSPTEFFGGGHAELLRRMADFLAKHP